MFNKEKLLIGLACVLISMIRLLPADGEEIRWAHDIPHSKAIFRVGHDNGIAPVTGWFNRMVSFLKYDGKDLKSASVTAIILVDSLNTGDQARDQHLRSEHFFDAAKYPQIGFKSTSIKPITPGKFRMTGDLQIKGKTKSVTLDCIGPKGPLKGDQGIARLGITATTHVNRKDFDMSWNREVSPAVFMVGDDVEITLEMEYVKRERRNTPASNPETK